MSEELVKKSKEQLVQEVLNSGRIAGATKEIVSKLSVSDLEVILAAEFLVEETGTELNSEEKLELYNSLKEELGIVEESTTTNNEVLTSEFEKKFHEKVVENRKLSQDVKNLKEKISLISDSLKEAIK